MSNEKAIAKHEAKAESLRIKRAGATTHTKRSKLTAAIHRELQMASQLRNATQG